jgi:hypothetical protein
MELTDTKIELNLFFEPFEQEDRSPERENSVIKIVRSS